jgi:predicted transcriptional regulator
LYFQGKTQVEIGKMLGTSQVQVSRKITKSLKKIRDHIKRSEEKPMVRKDAIIPSSSTNIKEPVKKQNDITFNENTTLSFMPKEVVQAPLLGNHEEIILTPTPEPIPKIQKSAFKNAFADTNVKSMLVELDRSCQAIFENYRVEFSDMVGSFTREDLIKRKKNIEKAIEIFDYIYNS